MDERKGAKRKEVKRKWMETRREGKEKRRISYVQYRRDKKIINEKRKVEGRTGYTS